jgi:hypothetical protein
VVTRVLLRKKNLAALPFEPHVFALVPRVLELYPILKRLRSVLDIGVFVVLEQLSSDDATWSPLITLITVPVKTKTVVEVARRIRLCYKSGMLELQDNKI